MKRENGKRSVHAKNNLVILHHLFLNIIFEKAVLDKPMSVVKHTHTHACTCTHTHMHTHPFVVVVSMGDTVVTQL